MDSNQDQENLEAGASGEADDADLSTISDSHKALLAKLVAAQLAPMKKNLDKAYADRDRVAKALAIKEQEANEAQIKRLEEDGKVVESLQMKLAQAEQTSKVLSEKLDAKTRDDAVSSAIAGVPFRSPKLAAMAARDIISQLVKDRDGNWVHRSGAAIGEFVKAYVDDADNSDMFTPKSNSGTGTTQSSSGTQTSGLTKAVNSVVGLSGAEVIALAAKGLLPKRQT